MSKEAMKLALEALKQIDEAMPFPVAKLAQSALREALASEAKEQPAQQGCMRCNTPKKCALYGCSPLTWPSEQPAQQQEPVALETVYETIIQWDEGGGKRSRRELARRIVDLYTSPPAQRKPLTHKQRVDLLAKFEPHKHEWHAPAILIDMVEAAHNIKEKNT